MRKVLVGFPHGTDTRTVIAAGHFPPPLHGMGVAVESFVSILEDVASDHGARVVRVSITGPDALGVSRHPRRIMRVLRAAMMILVCRGSSCAYVSVDAGWGMLYTLVLVAAARLRGTPTYLHHHAADYLAARTVRFAAVSALGAPITSHLVGCQTMADMVRRNYPRAASIAILPIEYAVHGGPSATSVDSASARERPLVLGHLSNLSVDKGLETVFDTAQALRQAGQECEVLIAGPIQTESDRVVLERRIREFGSGARHLGRVHGEAREAFFEAIDLFLFPSTYRHESFGLVVGEALVRGCPVIAFQNSCLTSDLVGTAGLVVSELEPFVQRAVDWAAAFSARPSMRDNTVSSALRFHQKRDSAVGHARRVAHTIVTGRCNGFLDSNPPAPVTK